MRMWEVNPKMLCNKHLLGEHVEMHMFAGTIRKGISIDGYIEKGLVNPARIIPRHNELAEEIESRGMEHNSPIAEIRGLEPSFIPARLNIRELRNRCSECRVRINSRGFKDGEEE